MARTTNQISSRVYTGRTGRDLRDHPPVVRDVQHWLMLNDGAVSEPYGLYHCELDLAVMQLGPKFFTLAAIEAAIDVLTGLDFCAFDPRTQFVWVKSQANFQLLEAKWQPLKDKDWKIRAAINWYSRVPDNPFLGPFYDLYGAYLRIPQEERRNGSRRPVEGASKPHASGAVLEPQDQDQRSDLFGEGGGVGEGAPAATMRSRRAGKSTEIANAAFDAWWELYPKKVGKGDARIAFAKMAPPLEQLMATTRAYIDSDEWREREDGTNAIPHPTTFLNGRRWEDTPTPKRLSRDHRRALGVPASPSTPRPSTPAATVWDEVVGVLKRERVNPDRLSLLSGSRMGDVITTGRKRPLMVIELPGDAVVACDTGDAIETIYGADIRRVLKTLGHDVDVHYGPHGGSA